MTILWRLNAFCTMAMSRPTRLLRVPVYAAFPLVRLRAACLDSFNRHAEHDLHGSS